MRRVGESAIPTAARFALVALAIACGGSTLSNTSVTPCHANADCPTGDSCQFSVYESCGGAGACVPTPDSSACIEQIACGCNGMTETVCLVNGNAPSPIESLGSCDGATQQQGFDASVTPFDATVSVSPDASDSSVAVAPDDSGQTEDVATAVDAADGASASLLGMPCTSSTQCESDPVYNECHTVNGTKICTATCFNDGECQPPANGTCYLPDDYCQLE
jgi:hypothetical protein